MARVIATFPLWHMPSLHIAGTRQPEFMSGSSLAKARGFHLGGPCNRLGPRVVRTFSTMEKQSHALTRMVQFPRKAKVYIAHLCTFMHIYAHLCHNDVAKVGLRKL